MPLSQLRVHPVTYTVANKAVSRLRAVLSAVAVLAVWAAIVFSSAAYCMSASPTPTPTPTAPALVRATSSCLQPCDRLPQMLLDAFLLPVAAGSHPDVAGALPRSKRRSAGRRRSVRLAGC